MTLRMIDDFHAHKGLTHSVLNVFNACSTITAVTSCELSPETGADRYARFVSLINRKFIHGDACGAKRAASNKTKRREKLNLAQAFFFQANVPLDGEKARFAQRSCSNYERIHARGIWWSRESLAKFVTTMTRETRLERLCRIVAFLSEEQLLRAFIERNQCKIKLFYLQLILKNWKFFQTQRFSYKK